MRQEHGFGMDHSDGFKRLTELSEEKDSADAQANLKRTCHLGQSEGELPPHVGKTVFRHESRNRLNDRKDRTPTLLSAAAFFGIWIVEVRTRLPEPAPPVHPHHPDNQSDNTAFPLQ